MNAKSSRSTAGTLKRPASAVTGILHSSKSFNLTHTHFFFSVFSVTLGYVGQCIQDLNEYTL